jgi:hypothetical protein
VTNRDRTAGEDLTRAADHLADARAALAAHWPDLASDVELTHARVEATLLAYLKHRPRHRRGRGNSH